MDFFAGKKTHFVGMVMILTGLSQVVFGPITELGGMDHASAVTLLMEGFGLMGLRLGIQKAVS